MKAKHVAGNDYMYSIGLILCHSYYCYYQAPVVSEVDRKKEDYNDSISLRSDVTVLDYLNKEYKLYPELFIEPCRTDLWSHHTDTWCSDTPTIDFEEYFCSTHSSGYDTNSDASHKTRDYFIARDLGIM